MNQGLNLPWRAVAARLAHCLALSGCLCLPALSAEPGRPPLAGEGARRAEPGASDPLASARWGEMQRQFIAGARFVFDPQVKVSAPELAENPLQVPVSVDASALAGVEEVVVFADFNPIVEILRFYPEAVPASLGFRVKLQQSTPVRAAARTADGVWHVGGSWVNTAGGGCTTPSLGSGSPQWQAQLNQVAARQWSTGPNAGRLRLKIVHPMDTGLVAGIPAFFLEEITLSDAAGRRLLRVQPAEPVAENPVFTLGGLGQGPVEASGRDNNGNVFSTRIAP